MNRFVERVKEIRSDLSDWLVHFTKGTVEEGAATLAKILSEAALRSESSFICFSEAPLGELNKLFALYRAYRSPRFAPFGIAVRKEWLFHQGGRPVIYGRATERDDLPEALQYRHVTYDPPERDFTWMREWRISSNHLDLEPSETIVIFPNEDAEHGLAYEVEVDYEYEGPDEVDVRGYVRRDWHSLTLNRVAQNEGHPDVLIIKSLAEQKLTKRNA